MDVARKEAKSHVMVRALRIAVCSSLFSAVKSRVATAGDTGPECELQGFAAVFGRFRAFELFFSRSIFFHPIISSSSG